MGNRFARNESKGITIAFSSKEHIKQALEKVAANNGVSVSRVIETILLNDFEVMSAIEETESVEE